MTTRRKRRMPTALHVLIVLNILALAVAFTLWPLIMLETYKACPTKVTLTAKPQNCVNGVCSSVTFEGEIK